MALVKVDTNNEESFEERKFEPIPPGVYVFGIANADKLEIIPSKSSSNSLIKVDLVVQGDADGNDCEYVGRHVWTNCVLSPKTEWQLTHLALAAGAMTKEEIKELGGVDIEFFNTDQRLKAQVGIDPGNEQYDPKNSIKKYLWEE